MLVLWGMKDFVFDEHFLDGMGAPVSSAPKCIGFAGPAITCFEDEADGVERAGGGVPGVPPRDPGACRLSQTSLSRGGRTSPIHLSSMAARQPHALAVVVPDGRDRSGPGSLHASDLPPARPGQRPDRPRLEGDGDRPRQPRGRDGPAVASTSSRSSSPCSRPGVVPVLIDPGIGLRNLGPVLSRGGARGLHRHPEGALGAANSAAGGARRCSGGSWSHRVAPGERARVKTLDDLRRLGRERREPRVRLRARRSRSGRRRDGGDPVHQRQHRSAQGGRVHPRDLRGSGRRVSQRSTRSSPARSISARSRCSRSFAPALGMTAVVPEMDPTRPARVDPAKIFEAIDDFGVTNLFGSPALLRRLVEGASGSTDPVAECETGHLRGRAGVAAVDRASRAAARTAGPGPHALRCDRSAAGRLDRQRRDPGRDRRSPTRGKGSASAGRSAASTQDHRIRDGAIAVWSDDLVVPDGQIGEIVVAGPVVTRRVLQSPRGHRTRQDRRPARADLLPPHGGRGLSRRPGPALVLRRKSHRVVLAGETLFTIPCEAIFNTHPAGGAHGSGRCQAERQGRARDLRRAGRRLSRAGASSVRGELLERGSLFAHTRLIRTICFIRSFPVDMRHNAKIFREKLAVWASRKLS